MAKQKRSSIQRRPVNETTDPLQSGLRAFHASRFDEAIRLWTPLAAQNPQVRTALAEAHFRQALDLPAGQPALLELQRAVELAPKEPRYHLHLGRCHHRLGDFAVAATHYRAALEYEPGWVTAAKLLALLTLEQDHNADLSALPGMTPEALRSAGPAQALLTGRTVSVDGDEPADRFWRGLGHVATGDPAALNELSDSRPLSPQAVTVLRRYYAGVAAARQGDTATALLLWKQVLGTGHEPAIVHTNMAALVFERLSALMQAGEITNAAELALTSFAVIGGVALDELRIFVLDAGAHAATAKGDWSSASRMWETARALLSRSPDLGSPRPLLHNMALAYERTEQWEAAADAWRAMLRTRRPRKAARDDASPEAGDLSAEQWTWVRARIITCYKHAGRPDEAVTVFRQMIKESPDDLDLRLQLADALQANEQERAANNEIQRILQIDPYHVGATLRQLNVLDQRYQMRESEQIMRDLVARYPDRADVRGHAARFFLEHGRAYAGFGRIEFAYDMFVEGEQYNPNDIHFPLNQARMLLALKRLDEALPLIERSTSMAGDDPNALGLVLETWVMADRLPEAQALLDRITNEIKLSAEALFAIAHIVMDRIIPPPQVSPFSFFNMAPTVAPAQPPVNTPWIQLVLDLLDRMVALKPDDARLLQAIATELMLPRPDLALRYAQSAVDLLPQDPDALLLLGVVQGLNEMVREAKATIKQAAQLASKQGKSELARQARELGKAVGSPTFRASVQFSLMAPENFDLDFDLDFDDFLE